MYSMCNGLYMLFCDILNEALSSCTFDAANGVQYLKTEIIYETNERSG